MPTEKDIRVAKAVSRGLVSELFPSQAGRFDDIWLGLSPFLGNLTQLEVSGAQFDGKALSFTQGFGEQGGQFWAAAVAVMVVAGAVLEMVEAGGVPLEGNIRSSVRKYAEMLGAPGDLRQLLEQKGPSFCLDVISQAAVTARAVPATGDLEADGVPGCDYLVLTHDREEQPMTQRQLVAFKKKTDPKRYFVWIDDTQPKVLIDRCEVMLPPMPRRVLAFLVALRGQTAPHKDIVQNCGTRATYETGVGRTSRLWVQELRGKLQSAKPGLKDIVVTGEGGFSYGGKDSFCLIMDLRRKSS
jgi:hypothetical protein